jgi:hypothetical protein
MQVDHQCVPSVQRKSRPVIIIIDPGVGHAGAGEENARSMALRKTRLPQSGHAGMIDLPGDDAL